MHLSRRSLVGMGATGAAFAGFGRLANAQAMFLGADDIAGDPYLNEVTGYGPLKTDPFGLFDLPEGFSYAIVDRAGDPMSDGLITPYKPDGMGCFAVDADRVALVRNHELKLPDMDYSAFGVGHAFAGKVEAARIYDRKQDGLALPGGTTTLVYNLRTRRMETSHLSLAGTTTNCAGGITPWGSWLSCEEIVQPAGAQTNGMGTLKSHGWVFEVPSSYRGVVEPVAIEGMGRFRHEAACIDPRTGVVYLTEDEPDGYGLFYRYLPNDPRALAKGGKLQALGFKDNRDYGDSRNWDQVDWAPGASRDVVWIDLDGVDNPDEALRARGHAKGAAWFARGEGVFFGQDEIFFCCTSGGPQKLGQIMRYKPSRFEGQSGEAGDPGRLQLFVQSQDKRVMNMCDNLAVAPWGHLIVCEDKAMKGGVNHLKAVTPQGKVYTIGRQAQGGQSNVGANAELAGAWFSPDGTTLFVNVYWPGLTIAITGPWARFQA